MLECSSCHYVDDHDAWNVGNPQNICWVFYSDIAYDTSQKQYERHLKAKPTFWQINKNSIDKYQHVLIATELPGLAEFFEFY